MERRTQSLCCCGNIEHDTAVRVSTQGDRLGRPVTEEHKRFTCSILDQQQPAIIMLHFTRMRAFPNSITAIFRSFGPYVGRNEIYEQGNTSHLICIAINKKYKTFHALM